MLSDWSTAVEFLDRLRPDRRRSRGGDPGHIAMKLLLVDGSNITMRAAFGGDIEPERATQIATGIIERLIRQTQATHMVVAMDSSAPSWRKALFPDYKAHRNDTTPWIARSFEEWTLRGWYVDECAGYEADDIIATLAKRADGRDVIVVSNDSDLLALAGMAKILRPQNGGVFEEFTVDHVKAKFGIESPSQLPDYKALVGEPGDNIPGVRGIGPKKAARLLCDWGSLESIITVGSSPTCDDKEAKLVAEQQATARLALKLAGLRFDALLTIMKLGDCKLRQKQKMQTSDRTL
jgi:DNA polymerase-1